MPKVTIIRPALTPEEREKRIKRLEQCLAQFAIAMERGKNNVHQESAEKGEAVYRVSCR
jgi:hypothetical protein